MKKRCKNCRGIVKIVEDEIENIEDCGRGVLCDLCGAFIEIPKQHSIGESSYPRYTRGYSRRYSRMYKKRQQRNMAIATVFALFLMIPIGYYMVMMPSPFLMPEQRTTTILLDNKTDIDVSDEVNITIFFSKFTEDDLEDEFGNIRSVTYFRNLSNYYIGINNILACDIKVDLRKIEYLWILIDPTNSTSYYSDYYFKCGNSNYNLVFYVSNISLTNFIVIDNVLTFNDTNDVNFNILTTG